ncbi:hypothetical protein Dimus_033580, partial [Dionaea muscipula]
VFSELNGVYCVIIRSPSIIKHSTQQSAAANCSLDFGEVMKCRPTCNSVHYQAAVVHSFSPTAANRGPPAQQPNSQQHPASIIPASNV